MLFSQWHRRLGKKIRVLPKEVEPTNFFSPDAPPLSYRRLVGAKATKLASCEKHLAYCLDWNVDMCFLNEAMIEIWWWTLIFFCQINIILLVSAFFLYPLSPHFPPPPHLTSHISLLFPLSSSLPTFFPHPFFLFPFTSIFFSPFLFSPFKKSQFSVLVFPFLIIDGSKFSASAVVECTSMVKSIKDNQFKLDALGSSTILMCRALSHPIDESQAYSVSAELLNKIGWQGINSGHLGLLYNALDENNFDFVYFRWVWSVLLSFFLSCL